MWCSTRIPFDGRGSNSVRPETGDMGQRVGNDTQLRRIPHYALLWA